MKNMFQCLTESNISASYVSFLLSVSFDAATSGTIFISSMEIPSWTSQHANFNSKSVFEPLSCEV